MRLEYLTEAMDRLRPAIITTVHGTRMEADHARWLIGKSGKKFLCVGFRPGDYTFQMSYNHTGTLSEVRDFYRPSRWLPSSHQDTTGYDNEGICSVCDKSPKYMPGSNMQPEPGDELEYCVCPNPVLTCYDAHRIQLKRPKFEKIITIKEENVVEVQWL